VAGTNGDSIDECLTAGALVSDVDGFRFRHEIARLAVEAVIPAHRRTDLHRQTLNALESYGHVDYARLSHHAEGAHDRAAVLRYAPLAAQRAADLAAHRESAAQYKRALRFADGLEPIERASLYDSLGAQAALIDRWEDVAETRQKALVLWRQVGDQQRIGDTLRHLSRAMWRLCRGAEAEATAASAVEVLEAFPSSSELAWAYANLAAFRMFHGDAEAVPLARKAVELAGLLGDGSVLSDALNTEATYLINAGEDGEELLKRALHVAIAAQSEEQAGRAFANLHAVLAGEYRLAEAEHCFAEAFAYCDGEDMATYGTCLRGERTHTLSKLGRWDEAESLCLDILQRQDLSPVNRLNPLIALARLRVRQGHPDAPSLLKEATTLAVETSEPGWIAMAGLSRVEAAWLAGDIQRAIEEARSTIEPARRFDSWVQGSLAVWLRRVGVGDVDLPWIAEPYARQLSGDWASAAELWLQLGSPYDAGLALLDSHDEGALREAVRIFDRLGATAAVAVAQALMRRLGLNAIPRGPRADTRADRFGLTRREQEILAHLCEGATNAEIATRLFISEKTVDHHVSAVLAKLGVESRHAAALKAKQSGVVGAAPR
jgi:DNA-binding CsgD family transcriptional regulator/tetratricopeptide (TPR) repeat protein